MKHIYLIAAILLFTCIKINAQTIDVITGLDGPRALLFNGNDLYFTQNEEKISKIDITDPSPTPIDIITGLYQPGWLALNGNDLYISEYENEISKIDITDPTPTQTTILYSIDNTSIVLNSNDLYFGTQNPNTIYKIDITDPTPTPTHVITVVYSPLPGAIIGNYLYYTVPEDPRISKIDITQNPPTEIHVTYFAVVCPYSLVAYGSDLYFSDPCAGNGSISRIDTTTNEVTYLLGGLDSPNGLAIKDNYLYIAERTANKISKLELPPLPPIINIPDTNFKSALVNTSCADLDGNGTIDGDVDTNNDGEIQVSEAEAVFGLNVSNHDIFSLIGVQNFINLTSLDCSVNQLINLNISNGNNVNLIDFNAIENTALFCIQVDDENYANNAPFWFKDNWAEYSEFCELGVEELDLSSQINIYPNPVKDILTIDNSSTTEITSIKLYDVLGRLVMVVVDDYSQIDVSGIDSGVFFLNIETDRGVVIKKIIKE